MNIHPPIIEAVNSTTDATPTKLTNPCPTRAGTWHLPRLCGFTEQVRLCQ